MYDFNNAEKQQSFELIPAKTIVPVSMTIRPGGNGDGGWITISKNSGSGMLDCEFTVLEGQFAKRKFWQYMVIDGNEIAVKISHQLIRAIIESSRGVLPDEQTPSAMKARQISSYGDLNGMAFPARIGIEKDKTGNFGDKNKIMEVITPDKKEWMKLDQHIMPTVAAPSAVPVPDWAK